MWEELVDSLRGPLGQGLAKLVRYLYFLRIAILLWLLPVILAALNETGARSLLSGIVTPVRWVQYLCAAFFLISAGFVSLVLARIVLLHGEERFGNEPPKWLARIFAAERWEERWWVDRRWLVESIGPVISQIPVFCLFVYFWYNGKTEQVSQWQIVAGVLAGFLLALCFWYAVSAFYFLTYHQGDGLPARTLIFPRKILFGEDASRILEDANVHTSIQPVVKLLTWLERFFPLVGYKKPVEVGGQLYEGHYFAAITFAGFFALYLALCPLTAPVPATRMAELGILLYELGQFTFLSFVLAATEAAEKDKKYLWAWKAGLSAIILLFASSIPALYYYDDAERFPILALVLILVIFLSWMMGALAFFFDRFRVPVLTVLITVLIAPRMMNFDGGREEHYLSIALRSTAVTLPTPGEILKKKLLAASSQPVSSQPSSGQPDSTPTDANKIRADQPLIVVTSTGGGIHAAAWTASVLRELETRFADDPSLGSFHGHVLLLSTVSGGSAGLYTYLRELDPKTNGGTPNWDRMNTEAQCSSLEAVGWGLVYYDIPKAIIPALPYLVPPSSGVNDLKDRPLFKDRTWALRKAFARNLDDPYCQVVNAQSGGGIHRWISLKEVEASNSKNRSTEKALTLGNFATPDSDFPAFSMNTTTVEGGRRFLSANYQVPAVNPGPMNPAPADSFLQIYGDVQFDTPAGQQAGTAKRFTDLPLATAAQMSATFPYVSSAATFPHVTRKRGVHFVDGGYYDNDGTASAIEFLSSALDNAQEIVKNSGPLRIILIEIRNSPDETPIEPGEETWRSVDGNNSSGSSQEAAIRRARRNRRTPPWNLFNQLQAPVNTFYSAGHESVTARNRRTLNLLKAAYKDSLVLQHFVIDDRSMADKNPDERPPTDPLNWSLTPAQQLEVTNTVANADNQAKFENIKQCFLSGVKNAKPAAPAPQPAAPTSAWQCKTGLD